MFVESQFHSFRIGELAYLPHNQRFKYGINIFTEKIRIIMLYILKAKTLINDAESKTKYIILTTTIGII